MARLRYNLQTIYGGLLNINRKYQPDILTRLALTDDAVSSLSIYRMFASGSYPSLVTKLVLDRRTLFASWGYSGFKLLFLGMGW